MSGRPLREGVHTRAGRAAHGAHEDDIRRPSTYLLYHPNTFMSTRLSSRIICAMARRFFAKGLPAVDVPRTFFAIDAGKLLRRKIVAEQDIHQIHHDVAQFFHQVPL